MLVRRPPPRALTASLLRRAQRGYTAADVEVARKAIAARRPQPEATDSTRVLYSPRVRRTFADIVTGRWRGHPIDLNHSHEDWARRESSDRHIRHVLTTFRSATFRRLLYPDLAVTTSISASVVLHNLLVAWEHEHTMTVESIERHGFDLLLHHEMITLPVEPFTMLSVALGLVLSVRTNRAYERFIEARVLLGSMTNVCRDLASRFMAREGGDAEAEQARRHAVCLVAAFAHTMKFHLTVDGLAFNDTWQRSGSSETLSKEALASEYRAALEQEILVIHELGKLSRSSALGLEPVAAAQIDDRLMRLSDILGGCERLMRTPMYSGSTTHTSRFLYVWCASLPLVMYPVVGPWGTVPVCAMMTTSASGRRCRSTCCRCGCTSTRSRRVVTRYATTARASSRELRSWPLVMHVQSGAAAWRPHKRTCRQPREGSRGVPYRERTVISVE
ncbi:hypothetical protein EMIHUDRAFT_439805 [Emiliania huxleyi CCMP1516]|uniref:Uncharacterized protein n=2 Tax=Emiliania huxleyi TaxID=2903 RepID=A0A0D3KW92_EMIH1|nr:hypothetical protein EMIHUDRAFT_439805 [Emiliania huxleyi CCMP1516]EOD40027.1 hypothetical protein EMIHUDRAFT_439805 [Emiliania huxleyi CCMP1516]|eukprot:XP_005792456.1 hypothetical protein EMIHUDRAFT_439805 [Emiliania huxleyi CCMP1516]